MTTFYLVRHGQSATNKAGTIGGSTDPDLTEQGRKEANDTKQKLRNIKFDGVYSSNLKRAVETAAIISGREVPKTHRLEGLRERHYGSLEGQPDYHFNAYQAAIVALPNNKRWTYRHTDDMENDQELVGRYIESLKKIAEHQHKNVLIVGHGAAIRSVLIHFGFGSYEELPPKSFKNAGYAIVTYDGKNFVVKEVEGIDEQIAKLYK